MSSADATPLRRFLTWLIRSKTTEQIALGVTLGMLIGLIPKTNLIALFLFLPLFYLRCDRALAIVTAITFTFLTPWTDPIAHKIGKAALTIPSMQHSYATLLNLPFGPWIGFHNTVVTGSLIIGIYVAYPLYWLLGSARFLSQRGSQI